MAPGRICPNCGYENPQGALACVGCGQELSENTVTITPSPVRKIVTAMIAVSLLAVGVLGFLGFQNIDTFRTQVDALKDANSEGVATVANATIALQSAHTAFLLFSMNYGLPETSQYQNDMIDSQQTFSEFLAGYKVHYSLGSLPRLVEVLTDEGRTDLLSKETLAVTELYAEWQYYIDDTLETERLAMDGQMQAIENSTLNATLRMEGISDEMASIMDCRGQASELLKKHADDAIQRASELTILAVAFLALMVVIVPLVILRAFTSQMSRKRP
jgi:hypothetical protein